MACGPSRQQLQPCLGKQPGDLGGAFGREGVTCTVEHQGGDLQPPDPSLGDHAGHDHPAMVEELRGNLGRALQLIGEGVRLADDSPRRKGIRTHSTWYREAS